MEEITDQRLAQRAFVKRRRGLMKKAIEIATLCRCDVACLIFMNGEYHVFDSTTDNNLLKKYQDFQGPIVKFTKEDWSQLESTKSSSSVGQHLIKTNHREAHGRIPPFIKPKEVVPAIVVESIPDAGVSAFRPVQTVQGEQPDIMQDMSRPSSPDSRVHTPQRRKGSHAFGKSFPSLPHPVRVTDGDIGKGGPMTESPAGGSLTRSQKRRRRQDHLDCPSSPLLRFDSVIDELDTTHNLLQFSDFFSISSNNHQSYELNPPDALSPLGKDPSEEPTRSPSDTSMMLIE